MENFEELFLGRKKKKNGIKDKIKKLGDKIKDGAKGAAMLPVLAPLAPFAGLMKKEIKKKGEAPKKGLKNIVEQFYSVVVKGKSSKENLVEDISTIVNIILKWIQEKKEKQDQGKATLEDVNFLKETEKALKIFNPETWQDDDVTTKSTKSESSESTTDSSHEEKSDKTMYIILALIVVALIANK